MWTLDFFKIKSKSPPFGISWKFSHVWWSTFNVTIKISLLRTKVTKRVWKRERERPSIQFSAIGLPLFRERIYTYAHRETLRASLTYFDINLLMQFHWKRVFSDFASAWDELRTTYLIIIWIIVVHETSIIASWIPY